MPPVTILSPYSGRPVKVREQDLGRALRDEQGRVFYIVEDPEHGRYAARTRKGSPKDLERYRQIESGVAKLDSDEDRPAATALQPHDATGKKRRNPVGLLLALIIAAVAALGYIYVSHPEWLGLDAPASDTETEADDEAASIEPASIKPIDIAPVSSKPLNTDPSAPGLAAAPLRPAESVYTEPARPAMPDGMDDDPEPVFVDTHAAPQRTLSATREPRIVPISIKPVQPQPRQTNYDDFRHTASGLRYKITHVTDGASARAGNYLTIRYTAETLDGKPLINDASQSFILASGQAIRAFDEGLAGIRQGEQLRLLVPRGHSDQGSLPGIKRIPDQPFLLDVQIVSVRPGVSYIIEKQGDIDARPAMPGDTVDLHYLARVEGREEVIDATFSRDKPMRITLGNNEVIQGLELGITGMRPGESRQLTIPPYLAYGKHSVAGGLIPENAVLSFRMTLVQIVKDEE
jgi:FKBP-type peptidyl-prolyl cis-trans isomerase